jgi:AraC-like DNA-binding protein
LMKFLLCISNAFTLTLWQYKTEIPLCQRRLGRTVSEIAFEVGYSNPSHFAQVFRRDSARPTSRPYTRLSLPHGCRGTP